MNWLGLGEGLLPAIAYGDAAGLPVEGQPATTGIRKLLPDYANPLFGGPAGMWSDDTQLSAAVIRGLLAAGAFDIDVIAQEHVTQLAATPTVQRGGVTIFRGWGNSTVSAVIRYHQGVPADQCGTKDGAGNGVLMKLAPLVLWQQAKETSAADAQEQWDVLTKFTHDSDIARVCTRVHAEVLSFVLDGGAHADVIDFAQATASKHEAALDVPGVVSEHLGDLAELKSRGERHLRSVASPRGDSGQLYGFYAPETLVCAYGAFSLWGSEPELAEAVYGAVSLGGDTDSVASIIAAMMAFRHGPSLVLPADYRSLAQIDGLEELSREFAVAAAAPSRRLSC